LAKPWIPGKKLSKKNKDENGKEKKSLKKTSAKLYSQSVCKKCDFRQMNDS